MEYICPPVIALILFVIALKYKQKYGGFFQSSSLWEQQEFNRLPGCLMIIAIIILIGWIITMFSTCKKIF